jgi:hypothetical protein
MTSPEPVFFVDFEASGIHPECYPIEIGISGPGLELSHLIKPIQAWTYWDYNAQDLHGITREMLTEEGVDIEWLCEQLNAHFAHQILWADSNYDGWWMESLFEVVGARPLFEVKNIFSLIDQSRLPDYYSATGGKVAHRALPDAQDLRACWLAYHRHIKNEEN